VLDGGVSLKPRPPYPERKLASPSTHFIEGWLGPRTGLVAVEKRKILPLPERTQAVQPAARRYPGKITVIVNVGQDAGKLHAPAALPLVRNGEKSKWYQLHLPLYNTTKEGRCLVLAFSH
jgi:hypothetical protein